jgi:hypothetical protein
MITGRRFIQLLFLLCSLGGAAAGSAQGVNPQEESFAFSSASSMPTWVVPVLRLVSSTHVEPTTGIVISGSGLVLVPAGFSSPGDEIIVLDGGTDILRNGRPAKLERNFPASGLKVLRVEGLSRSAAPFAATALETGSEVQLTAFPPAELIEQGEPPVRLPATVDVLREIGLPALSAESPLPNVTGALLDRCGNLAGVSLADEVQSMEVLPGTRYVWRAALLQILAELQLTPAASACGQTPVEPEPEPVAEPEPEPPANPEKEAPVEQAEEETVEEAAEEAGEEPAEPAMPDLEILPPIELDAGEDEAEPAEPPDPPESAVPTWLWLLAAAILFALGGAMHRYRQSREPDSGSVSGDPTTGTPAPLVGEDEEEWSEPGLDSRLVLHGELASGEAIAAECEVSRDAINLVIGRSEAELPIESAAVSRVHARLSGTSRELTITDLGSNNGTSINGVPCLEGEIMYVGPDDVIITGDARFTVTIQPVGKDADGQ